MAAPPFGSRELSDSEKQLSKEVISLATQLRTQIERIPSGRERSLAETSLELTVMWANKAIAQG